MSFKTTAVSDAHRHNDVFEVRIVRHGKQGRAVGIAEGKLHIVGMDVAQYVHQIADIEADFEFAALVGDFEFFAGFFLLVVAAHDAQEAGLQEQARAAEFFVGKDGGTFKRAQKLGA